MKNANVEKSNIKKEYEINLFKTSTFYNPLSVIIDGISFQLNKIHFYDKNGIVYTNSNSWFGDSSFNVYFKTTKEIKRKIKIEYQKQIPFIIKSKNDFDKRYDLYLPLSDFDLKVSYKKYSSMIIQQIQFYDSHNQLCDFKNCVKRLDNKLLDIRDKYEVHLKNINCLKNITEMYFLDELKTLKGLAEKYYKEQQYITKYTVEDYLKEIKRN